MMGVRIVVGENEPIQLALRRFKRKVDVCGITREIWSRQYARDATEERRTKIRNKRLKTRGAVRQSFRELTQYRLRLYVLACNYASELASESNSATV